MVDDGDVLYAECSPCIGVCIYGQVALDRNRLPQARPGTAMALHLLLFSGTMLAPDFGGRRTPSSSSPPRIHARSSDSAVSAPAPGSRALGALKALQAEAHALLATTKHTRRRAPNQCVGSQARSNKDQVEAS